MEASSPQAFAPHLRKAPLAGVPPRPLLLQFARGDVTDVNPNQAAIVRAGDLLDRAVMYRHDRFVCAYPGVRPAGNPHSFLMSVPCGKPPDARQCAFGSELPVSDAVTEIARFAQRQAAHFFETDGAEILTPLSNPDAPPQVAQRLDEVFDVPVRGPVPEDLGFVLPGATCQPR